MLSTLCRALPGNYDVVPQTIVGNRGISKGNSRGRVYVPIKVFKNHTKVTGHVVNGSDHHAGNMLLVF